MRYKNLIILSILAFAAVLCGPTAGFASILLSADDFAVLAGSTVTNTGPTTITGDVGLYSGTSITGAGDITLIGGTYYVSDLFDVALTAKSDLTTAYNALAAMSSTGATGVNLGDYHSGGLGALAPGVYSFGSAAEITGTLELDAQNTDGVYWVFQIPSTLTTAAGAGNSVVQLINAGGNNGADIGVFWVVGTATLNTYTAFEGNILALNSIALKTGATIQNGRALAQTGAVTMETNTISNVCPAPNNGHGFNGGLKYDQNNNLVPIGSQAVPEPSTMFLLGLGSVATALIRGRRKA